MHVAYYEAKVYWSDFFIAPIIDDTTSFIPWIVVGFIRYLSAPSWYAKSISFLIQRVLCVYVYKENIFACIY